MFLNGERIFFRAVEPSDAELLFQWENDSGIWKVSNTMAPYSRYQIDEYILNSRNDIYSARQLRLIIVGKGPEIGDIAVGAIDLFEFDPHNLRSGVGILIRDEFRNRGIASEAITLLTEYAFGHLNLKQLYCNITPSNSASIKLFEKAGFVRCGIKKDWNRIQGGWEEEWLYQLIDSGS